MSTTTNFKRIALVAVAALGLGVLSSVPSNSATTALSITPANGTATTATSDSTTAGSVAISFLSNEAADSVTVKVSLESRPSTLTTVQPTLLLVDTATIFSVVDTDTLGTNTGETITSTLTVRPNYKVAADINAGIRRMDTGLATSRTLGATFKVFMDTTTANDIVAGTYVNKVTVTPYSNGAAGTAVTSLVSIVVSTATNLSLVASSATSTAVITQGTTFANSAQTTDSASVSGNAESSGTVIAAIRVALKNASSGNAAESITVTTDRGLLADAGTTSVRGKSLIVVDDGAYEDIYVYADGTSGKATITISTPSVTFAAKTVSFYSDTAASAQAVVYSSVIDASELAVLGVALDSNKNSLGADTELYIYSSDTSVISNYGTACSTFNTTFGAVLCTLTGVKNGTANITLRDASTVALSTVASNAVAIKVNLNPAATATMSFNKATYAANEKATVTIKVFDKDGGLLPAGTFTNLFADGGITASSTIGTLFPNNPALSNVQVVTAVNASASTDTPVVTSDAIDQRTFYMPAAGTVTLTAKGGASLPLAGQIAITASASVTDSGAAALAAVTALATTVASLRTLIVTLTNLVLKIQKKVRA
jgi:hypothetical protein